MTLMYRCPGHHHAHDGCTFDAEGKSDVEQAKRDGWHLTLVEAVDAKLGRSAKAPVVASEPAIEPEPAPAPPDSEELLRTDIIAEMERLGLKVDKRKSNEKLLAELEAAEQK